MKEQIIKILESYIVDNVGETSPKIDIDVIPNIADEILALQLQQTAVSGCCVYRTCNECNQEYKVDLSFTADKTQDVNTFQNCPNCGKRDDVWIRITNIH